MNDKCLYHLGNYAASSVPGDRFARRFTEYVPNQEALKELQDEVKDQGAPSTNSLKKCGIKCVGCSLMNYVRCKPVFTVGENPNSLLIQPNIQK